MHADPPIFDPDSLEHLSPEMHKRVLAAQVKYAKAIAELAPGHAVALAHVHAAWARVHAATRATQTAQADRVVFEESIGAQAIGPSKAKEFGVSLILFATALTEAYFAFPGVRFATGQLGQIKSPLDDPVSLTAASAIGLMSVTVAHLAGENFSWSERSLMREPEPAELSTQLNTPSAVRADPDNVTLLEVSPLTEFVDAPEADDPFAPESTKAMSSVPPSQEVKDEEDERFVQVLRGGRSKGLYRKIGIGLVVLGVGMWSVNGVLRSNYLERLPKPTAPTASGIFSAPVSPTAHSVGLSDGATTASIVAFSILLFLLSAFVVFANHTPAMLRGKELQRRQNKAERALIKTVESVEKAIETYEKARSAIAVQKIEGRAVSDTARLPREDW
jgi:hypothetical protein